MEIKSIQIIPCPYCGGPLQVIQQAIVSVPVSMTIDGEPFTGAIEYMECPHCHKQLSLAPN